MLARGLVAVRRREQVKKLLHKIDLKTGLLAEACGYSQAVVFFKAI
jgi:hypothetical protein